MGATGLVIATGALALAWKSGEPAEQPVSRSQPECSEPWSKCSPNADWLREVLAKAVYEDVGPGTGSALVIPDANPSSQWFFKAVRPVGPIDREEYAPYDPLPQVGETVIYGSRSHVRLVWHVQGRNVYIEPPPNRQLLKRLVRLTQVVPAPAPEPVSQYANRAVVVAEARISLRRSTR